MYAPSQLPGPVQTGTALPCKAQRAGGKSTTFFTPLGLVLGDYLALLIYCVIKLIIKLRYLDVSSASTMWLERERESNALNIFLVDNFLGSIEWQKGETFKQYSTGFVLIHSLKGESIKSDSYRNLYNCHLKFHLTSWVLMVEMDTSRGTCLTGPHVQSSSKHLLTDQPADNGNAEQEIPFFFPLLVILAGFLCSTQMPFSSKTCRNLVTLPHSEISVEICQYVSVGSSAPEI